MSVSKNPHMIIFGSLFWTLFWKFSIKDSYETNERKFKGTPGSKNNKIFIDCQLLVKTNVAIFIFIGKLRNNLFALPVLAMPLFQCPHAWL